MDTGTVNVLHNTGNQYVFAVAYSVDLNLLTHKIFIYKHGVLGQIGNGTGYDTHKLSYVIVACGNLHALTAENVARSYQYGITERMCRRESLVYGKHSMSLRSLNVAVFEYLVKTLSVLCGVNVVGVGTENRDSEVVKRFCELYSGLTAELNYCAVWFFRLDYIGNVFGSQRLKIKLIGNVEIG